MDRTMIRKFLATALLALAVTGCNPQTSTPDIDTTVQPTMPATPSQFPDRGIPTEAAPSPTTIVELG